MVGYVQVQMKNLYYGSHQYIGHVFTAQAISGLLENMRHGLISLNLFMDKNGVLAYLLVNCSIPSLE